MEMTDEFDDWETGSGLLNDYVGTVIEAHFAPGNNNRYKLILTFMVEDNDDVSTVEEHYGCGDGWSSFDGGDTIKHNQPTRQINRNSTYGIFINSAVDLVGPTIKNWGGTRVAKTWIGSRWHMKEKTFGTGEYASTKRYPVEWLGIARSDGEGAVAGTLAGTSLRDQAITLLHSSNTHDEWVNACFGLTGFVDDEKLVREVADPDGLWKELKG